MLTVFLLCSEDHPIHDSETYWDVREEPVLEIGQCVSMGSDARWEVVRQDIFKGEDESVSVVFLNPQGKPTPDVEDWDVSKFDREFGLGGRSLQIVLSESNDLLSFASLFGEAQPSIGEEVFNAYERVPDHETAVRRSSPFYTVSECATLHSENALHRAIYLCRAKQRELIAV